MIEDVVAGRHGLIHQLEADPPLHAEKIDDRFVLVDFDHSSGYTEAHQRLLAFAAATTA